MDERRSQVLPEYTEPSESASKFLPKSGKGQLKDMKDQATSSLTSKNTEPEIKKAPGSSLPGPHCYNVQRLVSRLQSNILNNNPDAHEP
ncbi:hypothetical protein KDW_01760 [Dictyobacter vulcani]|uniref:Uncharacterized protein n=1 Tax=Dictyobacter vulcani TaxID=2607529 RepID=A0A5J4KBK6_9CHLR|nr:hypothetical protein KDW_01760 [Dictyobacter vulcani]